MPEIHDFIEFSLQTCKVNDTLSTLDLRTLLQKSPNFLQTLTESLQLLTTNNNGRKGEITFQPATFTLSFLASSLQKSLSSHSSSLSSVSMTISLIGHLTPRLALIHPRRNNKKRLMRHCTSHP